MDKTVLIAVDDDSTAETAIRYGIELAARTKTSPVLLAVSPPTRSKRNRRPGRELLRGLTRGGTDWRDLALAASRQKGLDLEVFVTSGRFSQEIIRFVRSRPAVQFVIVAAPRRLKGEEESMFSLELEHLHEECESEILLVENAGQVKRVSDPHVLLPEKETSA